MTIKQPKLIIVIVVLAIILAFIIGWKLWHKTPVIETYATEQHQKDGSVVLERKPDVAAKSTHEIPKGGKVERIVKLEVKSKPVQVRADAQAADCPPVKVDLSLVRMPDETRRVIASSSTGEVFAGVDIPVESAFIRKEPKWAAGLTVSPINRSYGVFIDRDLGPFRIGAEVNQSDTHGLDFRLRAGLRF